MRTTSRALARPGAVALLTAIAVLALAACGGSSGATGGGGATRTTVTAAESEFAITLSKSSLAPGTYTFVAKNTGTVDHALEIEGPGVDQVSTETVAPGSSAQLTVTLQQGTYAVYCPVAGHRDRGMQIALDVGGDGATTETKTTGGGYDGY